MSRMSNVDLSEKKKMENYNYKKIKKYLFIMVMTSNVPKDSD